MAIPLRIVWTRLHVVDTILPGQLIDISADGRGIFVRRYDCLGDPKPGDDVVAYKVCYSSSSGSSEGYASAHLLLYFEAAKINMYHLEGRLIGPMIEGPGVEWLRSS